MTKTSLDKSKIKILLLEGVHSSAVQTFTKAGYSNVELLAHALEGDELKAEDCRCALCRRASRAPS